MPLGFPLCFAVSLCDFCCEDSSLRQRRMGLDGARPVTRRPDLERHNFLLQLFRRRHGRGRVLPGNGVPADTQNFHEHAHSVAERIEAGAFAVGPQNRDLGDTEAGTPSQKKNFGIESPTFDFLQRKDALGGLPPEGFESTLRVRRPRTTRRTKLKIRPNACR